MYVHTDAHIEKVQLEQTPETVVAQSSVAAALCDSRYQVDGVYGWARSTDSSTTRPAPSTSTTSRCSARPTASSTSRTTG